MSRVCLLVLIACCLAAAAPVPKDKPDPVIDELPAGATVRLGDFRLRGSYIGGLTFSPDGKKLLVARKMTVGDAEEKKQVVRIHRWDARTGGPLAPTDFPSGPIDTCKQVGDRLVLLGRHTDAPGSPSTSTVRAVPTDPSTAGGEYVLPFTAEFAHVAYRGHTQIVIAADGTRGAVIKTGRQPDETESDVRLFDLATGTEQRTIRVAGLALGGAFSSDGASLAVFGQTITRHDLTNGKELLALEGVQYATAFAVSPDGTHAVGCADEVRGGEVEQECKAVIWDTSQAKPKHHPAVDGSPWGVAFVGNDAVLVGHNTPAGLMSLARWSVKTGEREWSALVPFDSISRAGGQLLLSPDGRTAVVCDGGYVAIVFDTATGKRLDDSTAHEQEVEWVGFAADGKTVSSATNFDAKRWDAATGKLLATFTPTGLKSRRFVGELGGQLVWWGTNADGKREVAAFDAGTGKRAWTAADPHPWSMRPLVGDGRVVVVGGEKQWQPKRVVVYTAAGKKEGDWELGEWSGRQLAHRAGAISGGELLFAGEVSPTDSRCCVLGLGVTDGKEVGRFTLPKGSGGVYSLTPAVGGKVIVTGQRDGWVAHDATSGAELAAGELYNGTAHQLVASADGKRVLATGYNGKSAYVIDPTGKTPTKRLDAKLRSVSAVAFSPDGKRAVVGYRDGTALIWDVSK